MPTSPIKPAISIGVLNQVDIRVGQIQAVEDIQGSDKLVRLRVNFAYHTRTIVAALIQERMDPKEIEGRQALFVINLEPRKIRGVVSEGMLFDIGYADGNRSCRGTAQVACLFADEKIRRPPQTVQ